MSGGWPVKPNLEWRGGLVWCCDTLGYVTPSDRWDHAEESTEAMIAESELRAATRDAGDDPRESAVGPSTPLPLGGPVDRNHGG